MVADFNGDGNLDVATVCYDSLGIYLSYGNGDGTLQKPVTIKLRYGGALTLVTADFNKDHAPDLAVGSGDDLAVLMNAR